MILPAPSDQQANMIESNNFEAYKRSQNEEIKQQILAWASSEEVRQRMLRPDIRIVRMEGVGGHLLKK